MYLKKGYLLSNRYEIGEKIGAGGMSIVYKATCLNPKRTVAIKVLREEFVEDEKFVDKFISEAQQVANLNHTNIVNIYDVGNDGDIYYIVMEYLEGKDLENIIHKVGKVDTNAALTILYNIGEALSYAHKNGVVHRDLKSKNIIINDDGTVKVADFGIATATTTSTLSVAINAIGSVHYFSPEQAKGEKVDERSDIYSLGIIGYELITGKLPFDGDTPVQVALKQVTDRMPKPSDMVDVTENIDFLILKATSKDPLDRYQTVDELLHDIDEILDGNDIVNHRILAGGELKKDEVIKFSKILDDYKDEQAEIDKQTEIDRKNEIARNNLEKLDDVTEKISDDEESNFDKLDSLEKKEAKKREKFDNFLAKLGIIKKDEDEDLDELFNIRPSFDQTIDDDEIIDNTKETKMSLEDEIKKSEEELKKLDDENEEIYHEKRYVSLDRPISDSKTNKARDLEEERKAAIAAAKFFDKYEEATAINNAKKKKKFNLLNFLTVEVEDDLTDEEYERIKAQNKKEKREQKRKEREESYLNDRKDEEMSDGYMSKDDDRKLVKAAVITSLVIIGFILIGMIKYIVYLSDNRLMEVPNLVGENFEEAKAEWKKKGFVLEEVDEEVSQKIPEGSIVSQNHEPGTKIARHSRIEVVLSKGKFSAIMPDLQARSVEEAIAALEKYSVHITTSAVASEDIQEGYIVSTSPSYGTVLSDGMNVVLYISQNDSDMYIMPNLVGYTLDEAKEAMEKVGLKLGDATYETGVNKDEAVVINQNVAVGTSMFSGQKAKVTMGDKSKAPEKPVKKDDKEDEEKDDDTTSSSASQEETPKQNVKMGKATITVENKEVPVEDAKTYSMEFEAVQPTLGKSSTFKTYTGQQIKARNNYVPLNVEENTDINVYIDGQFVKKVHFDHN